MTTPAASVTLSHWLRLLWNIAPPLRLGSEQPYLAEGALHLPACSEWREHLAAAAHVAAHLLHSPRRFDGAGLGPIARALIALIEDARAEAEAMRVLPTLGALWRPWHTATPALGNSFEALMQRLARALIDADYDDPDPWVRKGRALFYADAPCGACTLHTPEDVRMAALRLGHDIGQMRLQFNAKIYRPLPAYRDDHRWMWAADVLNAASPPAAVIGSQNQDVPVLDGLGTEALYPEWDHLISRLRPAWCRVIEQELPALEQLPSDVTAGDEAIAQSARRLRRAVRVLVQPRYAGARYRDDEGELFDPGALVDRHIARRLRRGTDPRIYRGCNAREPRAAVWLLIDQSLSTAAVCGTHGQTILQLATTSALATATALQVAGVDCAVAGFHSYGRHAVRMTTVKSFGKIADADMAVLSRALQPGGSTRLGAALRHATHQLEQRSDVARWVIVLSDGEPYDVDVHDSRYLIEDARHAVRAAARLGVRIVCAMLASEHSAQARRIFGRHGVQRVRALSDLPQALTRLIA